MKLNCDKGSAEGGSEVKVG